LNQPVQYRFVADGRRLVDVSGEFEIRERAGPDYYRGAVVGFADHSNLYEFAFETSNVDGNIHVVISRGWRDHSFIERLIGRTRPLLESAIPAILQLPTILEQRTAKQTLILMAPANIIEYTLYGHRDLELLDLIEIARVKG
jgi:hypothetical protein